MNSFTEEHEKPSCELCGATEHVEALPIRVNEGGTWSDDRLTVCKPCLEKMEEERWQQF